MAEARDVVTLTVGGRRFEAWKTVSVAKGIADVAGAFSLEYAERTSETSEPVRVRRGESCVVSVGGETVITGWIDAATPDFDPENRTLRVEGRDKASDLVDCSALNTPGVWRGRTLIQIATDLVKPFGLSIEAAADVGQPFRQFAIEQGETVWDAIERLARFRGLLAVSTAEGGLRFIRPGQARAGFSLRQGVELIAASAGHDGRDRFSTYVLKGQSAGDDEVNGVAAAGPRAEVTDPGVTRHRPLLIIAEEQATLSSLRDRAAWEASRRAAEGETADLTVQGWRDPTGAIWKADQLVRVVSSWLDIDAEMLIADVTFSLTPETGSTTVLRCVPPDAYRPEPPEAQA